MAEPSQKVEIPVLPYKSPGASLRPKLDNPAADRSLHVGLSLFLVIGVAMMLMPVFQIDYAGLALVVTLGISWCVLSAAAIVYGFLGCRAAMAPDVKGMASSLLGVLLGMGGMILVVLIIGAHLAMENTYGPGGQLARARCAGSLTMIHRACAQYSATNGGQLPPSLEQLCADDLLSPDHLICYGTDHTAAAGNAAEMIAMFQQSGHCSYVYLGAGMTAASAASSVIVYEPLENHEREGINVLYGDGRIVWLSARDAKTLIAKLPPPKRAPVTTRAVVR